MNNELFREEALTLELVLEPTTVRVAWSGRSTAREPSKFIVRVLTQAIELCRANDKTLELDFQKFEYMNSSTITPLIRILDHAKRAGDVVRIFYNRQLKWQELSFTALQVFQTEDGRIKILGV